MLLCCKHNTLVFLIFVQSDVSENLFVPLKTLLQTRVTHDGMVTIRGRNRMK
jgi:hypothetical protein